MGYNVFGSVYVLRLFGRYFTFSSPGCRRLDFRETAYSTERPRAVIGHSASTTAATLP